MVHTKSIDIRAELEREKLVQNLEQHRRVKKKLTEVMENVRRLRTEASTLQKEAEHLVAQSRKSTRDF